MKFLRFAFVFMLFSGVANAQTNSEVKEIENYLNSIKSIKANFVQMSSNGGTAEGKLLIAKPNRLRMEYAEPTNVLIVGNGDFIVYNDKDLDQVTHIDYDDIPAALILANDIKIDGKKIKITDFYKDKGTTSITLDYGSKSEVGPINLVFSNNPLELKQWKIVDPQSVEVTISLYNSIRDEAIDASEFKFKKQSSKSGYRKQK